MKRFLEALNHPADAFRSRPGILSALLVVLTVFSVTLLDPLFTRIAFASEIPWSFDPVRVLILTTAGLVTYPAICTAFWLLCRVLGSRAVLMDYLAAWGITFFPTLLCAILVSAAEAWYFLFWNNSVLSVVLGILFVGILVWKTMLYVLFLQRVAGLKGARLVGGLLLCGAAILVFAGMNAWIGLKTPIL